MSCSGAARFESAAATGLPSPRTTGSSTMSSSQGGDQPGKGVKGMFGRLKNGCRLGDRKKGYEKVIRVNLDKTSWDVAGNGSSAIECLHNGRDDRDVRTCCRHCWSAEFDNVSFSCKVMDILR